MGGIKKVEPRIIREIIATSNFDPDLMIKDYYITIILYLIKDIKGIYFKGGTALQKTALNYSRISEDIDFTVDVDIATVRKQIVELIESSGFFGKITKDKGVNEFLRLVVSYKNEIGVGQIFIDLNKKAKLLSKSQNQKINHIYTNIPLFDFPCLSLKEMIAEKVAAAIGRNKPRDHYDIYQIIKHKLPIDMGLVGKKCRQSGCDPSIIKMFNKAKKLYNVWNSDMIPLIVKDVGFEEVMSTLSRYFNLKEEKEKIKGDC